MIDRKVESYVKNINTYPKTTQYPNIGRVYVFEYLFNQTPDFSSLKNRDEIKFYDFVPATFVMNVNPKNKTFTGFNLHSIPIFARTRWIEVIRHYVGDPDRMSAKDLLPLKRLLFSSKNYSMKKVRKFREVPVERWNDLLQFDANTTFDATSGELLAKYLSFIK